MLFANKVYASLRKVPRGRVTTYQELARAVGSPRAARAVGNALNKNPDAPKTPCHRVVQASGQIGGYAHGLNKKIMLLESEGVVVEQGRVKNFSNKLYKF